tara:strand:+ start:360 stop:1004 length:645 start_codon:yes stop_codon:yes gene_type:complete
MCAIFGSTERSKFISLYELNKDRGGYATTFSGIKNDTITTFKRKMFDIDNLYLEDWDYYLGHHQAPTSSVRKYSEKTSHPFNYGRWHVAHNGVLMNHKEVTEASDTREIDTSYIPAFMEELDLSPLSLSDKELLEETFSAFKGTHTCWVWDDKNSKLYLTKNGSTLFIDGENFSSVEFEGSKSLLDGYVYSHHKGKGFIELVQFTNSNPFAVFS